MALLHALVALRAELEVSLHVAHLDHRLRPDSGEDRVFVRKAAGSLSLPIHDDAADVRALAAAEKRSIEDAARRARYRFFAKVAADAGAAAVATAHSRSDQVETVLMRTMDGAPWELLAGIPPVRPLGAVRVVRPLIDVWRREILDYLNGEKIPWREDPTNLDPATPRNWVRQVCLPALARQAPALPEILEKLGETVAEAVAVLRAMAEHLSATHRALAGRAVELPLRMMLDRPPALQRQILRRMLAEAAGTTVVLPRVVEDEALGLVLRRQHGEVHAGSWVIRTAYDTLIVAPAEPSPPPAEEYALPVPGQVAATVFGIAVSAEIITREEVGPAAPGEVYLDADEAGPVLTVRGRRAGDRFRPLGMKGNKKVQDLLVDQKVPRWARGRIPIVVDTRGRIVWVVGQRVAEDVRVREATTRILLLRVRAVDAAAGRFA